MSLTKLTILTLLILTAHNGFTQDTILGKLEQIPKKYITQIDAKADKYYIRITTKTEKTLKKLSKWEEKIKALLEKANPESAQRLFGNNQLSFATVLEKYKQGKAISDDYRKQYNDYRDKLNNSIAYLDNQKKVLDTKLIKPVKEAKEKLKKLGAQEDNTEAVQQFIKERKKQLIDQSIQYIGKSKYLSKISKEAYFYAETLRNYKEIFQDKKKAEETAITILNKIPAFQKFFKENSMLASLFRTPGNIGTAASLAGLQTRSSVNSLIQARVASGGPNAQQQIMQNIQAAQNQLTQLKDKIIKAGGNSSDADMPDFKPNLAKTKTFKQRLKFGSNYQFSKTNSLMPATADIGMSVGFVLNGNSEIGIGASYKLGLGSIQHIKFSNEGAVLKSYLDYKLKKQFYISGGFEMNYFTSIPTAPPSPTLLLQERGSQWQTASLLGISKTINIKTKWFKGSKISLLYNFKAKNYVPVSSGLVFRMGYLL